MASTPRRNEQEYAPTNGSDPKRRCASLTRRVATTLALACIAAGLGGCDGTGKTIGDYLNLRNSFLNPAEVGRFDKANPWGSVKPVKWPILEQLDVIDAPANEWDSATEPTPADIVAQNKEFTIGAGDAVRISIYDLAQPGQEYLKETTVSEIGTVDLLYIGSVHIGGLTPTEANEKIGQEAVEKRALVPAGNGAPGPQVSVTVLQSRSRIFSILGLGTVSRPGTYNIIGSDFRVLDALALAGDIQVQPGLDYVYVIRDAKTDASAMAPAAANGPAGAPTPAPAAPAAGNPIDALNGVENSTTSPAPSPAPAAPGAMPAETAPAPLTPGAAAPSAGPSYVRPLPTAVVMSAGASGAPAVSQADLDAALTEPAASTAPATAATTAPGKSGEMLDQALDTSSPKGEVVNVGGKWVTLPSKTTPATLPGGVVPETATGNPALAGPTAPAPTPPGGMPASATDTLAAAQRMSGHRVIRIPIAALRSGDPRYNIIIKPGDTIIVPPVETGEFYVMGHVSRPGVFALTGRKITLKMAIAAAGNLDALAIPRRCDLVRRIGTNQEAIVQVNLQAIFDGTQPDIFLKPNDLINVGTDAISPFLAVTRNAYRFSYGLGFVYDRNYYIQPTVP